MAHPSPPPSLELPRANLKKVALLSNTMSGKGAATQAALTARKILHSHGIDVTDLTGPTPEDSRHLAKTALHNDAYDALFICGGDGLVNLVLQSAVDADKPIGIIPGGTGNDHARELGIPLHAARATRALISGVITTFDAGLMYTDDGDQRYFGTIACAGFDSLVTQRTNDISWPKGRARYNVATLIEFLQFHSVPARVTLDDDTVIDRHLTMLEIGNTKSYGGGMYITPYADPHDGVFDLTFVGQMNRMWAATKMFRMMNGDHEGINEITHYSAKKIRVDMPGIQAFADGEPFFNCPVTCEVVPNAVNYIVPRP
ncbi:diacylglycerol kinase family protein [Corynebacterium kroppenstedtii]|uniref:diacylglycerol kinase family protein n=1 Tax=Corynebacterium sp. PCR 32 TaxID=3351342 RepID=UPI0030A2FD84